MLLQPSMSSTERTVVLCEPCSVQMQKKMLKNCGVLRIYLCLMRNFLSFASAYLAETAKCRGMSPRAFLGGVAGRVG